MSEKEIFELVELDPEEVSLVKEPAVEEAVFLIKKSAESEDTTDEGADAQDAAATDEQVSKEETADNAQGKEIDKATQPAGYAYPTPAYPSPYGYPAPGGYISPKAIIAFLENAAKATDSKEKKEKIKKIIELMKEVFVSKEETLIESLVERMDRLENAVSEIKEMLSGGDTRSEEDVEKNDNAGSEENSQVDKEIIELTNEVQQLIESGKLSDEEIEILRTCIETLQTEGGG